MSKFIEVADDMGRPTMIPFHRVIRVVKCESHMTYVMCMAFDMDGGTTIWIPVAGDGQRALDAYRDWVANLS